MKNYKYLVFSLVIVLFSTTSCVKDEVFVDDTPVVATSTVKLNEIMSTGSPDWIELYNGGSESVDLSGYKLTDNSQEWFIDNLIIDAGGYVTFDCDDSNVPNVSTNFKISSGGEEISLFNATGEIIDQVTTPDMSSQSGLTYGRENDGADNWLIIGASKGAANSSSNTAPLIAADSLTEFDSIYEITVSDADGLSSVNLILITDTTIQSLDMVLVDGNYKISVPQFKVGTQVQYYVKATDNTGLVSYYPENGSSEPAQYTVAGGVDGELVFSEAETGIGVFDFTFSGKIYYKDEVDEVRVYYVLNDELHDETVVPAIDTKDRVKIPASDIDENGNFMGTIKDLKKGDKITYYIRVEYLDGTKTYHPIEETDENGVVISDFDHDLSTTWPSVVVGEIPVAPVNGFSELTITNETGTDLSLNVKVEYDNGDVNELKFYYVINYDAATMWWDDDANPATPDVFDDATHRVTIEVNAVPSADNTYTFTVPGLTIGDNLSWYMRAKDGNGDKLYYTFGKTANEFDGDAKDDPANWNVVVKN